MTDKIAEIGVNEILPVVMILVVAGIGAAFGLQVMGEVRDDMGSDSCSGFWNSTSNVCQINTSNTTTLSGNPAEFNATGDAITGVGNLTSKFGTIGTVIAAAIILGLLGTFLVFRSR